MKFIHTADWHIGPDFYHYDRGDEHRFFFSQLREWVATEQPDALLVSGDIYHTATPSNQSMKLYTEAMVSLHAACPKMQIIVTAGNHDSCARLSATAEVWKLANVQVVGGLERDAETGELQPERHVIEIPHKVFIIAVPYISEKHYAVFQELQDWVEARNRESLPVVMMGHLAVKGSDISGHDPVLIGGMESASLDHFSEKYDYWALGHIHCPQTLSSSGGRVRYSGSPLHVSFDENYPHSVSLVEIEHRGDVPRITQLFVRQRIHLCTMPAQPQPWEEVAQLLSDFQPEEPAYLRLQVSVEDYLPQASLMQLQQILSQKPLLYFCLVKSVPRKDEEESGRVFFDVQEIKEIHPVEVAKVYYRETFGHEMEEDKIQKLEEVVACVMRERNMEVQ